MDAKTALENYASATRYHFKVLRGIKCEWDSFHHLNESLREADSNYRTMLEIAPVARLRPETAEELFCIQRMQAERSIDQLSAACDVLCQSQLCELSIELVQRYFGCCYFGEALLSHGDSLLHWLMNGLENEDPLYPPIDLALLGEWEAAFDRELNLLKVACDSFESGQLRDQTLQAIALRDKEFEPEQRVAEVIEADRTVDTSPNAHQNLKWPIRQSQLVKMCHQDRTAFERWIKAHMPPKSRAKKGQRWIVSAEAFAVAWRLDERELPQKLLAMYPAWQKKFRERRRERGRQCGRYVDVLWILSLHCSGATRTRSFRR